MPARASRDAACRVRKQKDSKECRPMADISVKSVQSVVVFPLGRGRKMSGISFIVCDATQICITTFSPHPTLPWEGFQPLSKSLPNPRGET